MSFFESFLLNCRRAGHWCAHAAHKLSRLREPDIIVLGYHSLVDDGWRYGIGLNEFKRQIAYLAGLRRPLSATEYERYLQGKGDIDKPSFLLTFDDGYKDIMQAADFLREQGIRPIVFVIADPDRADRQELGTDRLLLTTGEIKQLSAAGWDIGCHSLTHGDFYSLDVAARDQEIRQSKISLEEKLGQDVRWFAYPRGRYSDEDMDAVREVGYSLAFSMDEVLITSRTDPRRVPRIGIDRTHCFSEFTAMFNQHSISFRRNLKRWF